MKKYLVNVFLAIIMLLIPFANFGQMPVLGTTSDFALYTSAGSLINNGASVITGNIASYNVAPVGFTGPGTVNGIIYPVGDPFLVQPFADAGTAFGNFSSGGSVLGTPLETTETLFPGVCHTIGAASLNGNFTLDALGDPNAIFVININGALAIGAGSNIILANSAQFCNVYWQINGAFTLGAGSVFGGTIISNAAITLLEGAKLYGRGITIAGAITLNNNEVIFMPAAAGTITGTSAVCQGQTGVIYSVPAIANATSYVWTLPAGATITAGINTNCITVSFSGSAVSGNINVKGSNACGSGTVSANFAITINPSVVASVDITGVPSGAICAGTSVVFTASPTNAVTPTYQWKKNGVAITGATNISYTTTTLINGDIITVDMSSTATVCQPGSVSTSNSIAAIINPLPTAAGNITGNASVCQGQTGVIYTVPVITNATSYIWTLPVGATITAGASTNSITVSYSTSAVSGNITVKGSNTCGSGIVSANFAVIVNILLSASVSIAAVPSGAICAGTSVVFTATPSNAVSPTYQWKVNGIAISGATNISYTTTTLVNSDIITVDMSSSATVCQAASVSTSNSINITVNPLPLAAGTITGSSTVCQGQTGVIYSVPVITNATSYIWTLPIGATITSGANTRSITVSYSTIAVNGNITVEGSNTCGTGTVSANYAITVNSLPIAAGTITGTASVCQGQTGVNYTVPVITNATSYIWAIPINATITAGANTNSITVSYATSAVSGISSVVGNITVRGSNTCGIGTISANYAVTINSLPIAAGTITGTATICQGQTGVVYSVPTITNATSYIWTLPVGASITAGSYTNSITVSYGTNAVSGNITVQGSNTCGTGTVSANYTVTVNSLPVAAGTITGTAAVCQGQTGIIYTVPVITNATSYNWTLPVGASITAGANTNSITVSFSGSAVSGNINVQGSNTCGLGTVSANYAITVNPLPIAAGIITGTATICQGQTGVVYSVPTITNATSYIWTLPVGATITTGANTHSITVSFSIGALSGNITVQGSNTCGTGAVSANYTVTVNPLPIAAGTITGSASVCQGQTGVIYTVPVITNATSYIWTLPTGVTITAGANTHSITVSFSSGAVSGNISVQGSNSCGMGTVSANYAVTVNLLPVAAGAITGTSAVCKGETGVVYSVPVITNATSYIWTLPVGATITSGANTHIITVSFSQSAVSGNITVQGSNTCGTGTISANYAVTVNSAPLAAGTITGSSTACQGYSGLTYSVPAILNATGYIWTLPIGVTITAGANTNTITVDFSSNAVSGYFTVKGSSICGFGAVSPNFAVTVNSLPGAAGIITGSSSVCTGQTGVNYSIPVINNVTNYIWTLPVGATITAGANTHMITVSFGPNAVNGNIYVQGQNNCGYGLVSTIFVLTVNTAPHIIGQPISQTVCTVGLSASFTVAATGTNLTYQWRKGTTVLVNGGNISGATTSTLTINPVVITDAANNYNVVINGICMPAITSVNVSLVICEDIGIDPENNGNSTNVVTIYPNPFTSTLAVRINDESKINKCELRILDVSGNLVLNQIITQKLTTISTNNLVSGVYVYEVISENKVIQSGKLISNQ